MRSCVRSCARVVRARVCACGFPRQAHRLPLSSERASERVALRRRQSSRRGAKRRDHTSRGTTRWPCHEPRSPNKRRGPHGWPATAWPPPPLIRTARAAQPDDKNKRTSHTHRWRVGLACSPPFLAVMRSRTELKLGQNSPTHTHTRHACCMHVCLMTMTVEQRPCHGRLTTIRDRPRHQSVSFPSSAPPAPPFEMP